MKRIILFIASVTLLMTACNKTEPAPTPEQYDKYIFFSHSVETKASLIEDKADLEGLPQSSAHRKADSTILQSLKPQVSALNG